MDILQNYSAWRKKRRINKILAKEEILFEDIEDINNELSAFAELVKERPTLRGFKRLHELLKFKLRKSKTILRKFNKKIIKAKHVIDGLAESEFSEALRSRL